MGKKLGAANATGREIVRWTAICQAKNGTFKGTIDLPTDTSYEFRYLVDSEYQNDEQADKFVWNEYAGTDNAVLEL